MDVNITHVSSQDGERNVLGCSNRSWRLFCRLGAASTPSDNDDDSKDTESVNGFHCDLRAGKDIADEISTRYDDIGHQLSTPFLSVLRCPLLHFLLLSLQVY